MTHLLLTGHDTAADRAALQALVSFQRTTPADGLPAPSREDAWQGVAAFQARALSAAPAPFSDRERAAFERALGQLADGVLAQPQVALLTLPGPGARGPVTHDIAHLLRQQPLPDEVELDLAVRWWQLARAAGLPVDDDFGETWRALEWSALWQLLLQLAVPGDPATEARRLEQASRVALRYGPLKPLLRLLQPLGGAAPGAGFTF